MLVEHFVGLFRLKEKTTTGDNMNDKILEKIAKKYFRVETLQTRNRDSLDFYDVAVWNIKAALKAAYEAGENK